MYDQLGRGKGARSYNGSKLANACKLPLPASTTGDSFTEGHHDIVVVHNMLLSSSTHNH